MSVADTVRWLEDRELIKDLPQRYAQGVDRKDFAQVRACFHDDCFVDGSLVALPIDEYVANLETGVAPYEATLHFMGNQYVDVAQRADEGHVETYAVAYHMWPPGSDDDDLVMAVRYMDDVVRTADGWIIRNRTVRPQWVRGPLPAAGEGDT